MKIVIMFFLSKKKKRKEIIGEIPLLYNLDTKYNIDSSNVSEFKVLYINDAFDIFWQHWNHQTISLKENYMVLYLRDNLSVIGIGLEAIGDKTSCSVYLRRIINRAIAINAAQIVTSHNHPLGSTKPSSIDIYNEKKLRTLAIQKGINHAEHLIISPKKRYYFSFIEAGLF